MKLGNRGLAEKQDAEQAIRAEIWEGLIVVQGYGVAVYVCAAPVLTCCEA